MKNWFVKRCLQTRPPPVRTPLTSQIHPTNAGREVSPRAQGHGFCILLGHCRFHYPVCWYFISKGDCLCTNGLPFGRTQQFNTIWHIILFFLACHFISASWCWLTLIVRCVVGSDNLSNIDAGFGPFGSSVRCIRFPCRLAWCVQDRDNWRR